MPPKSKYVCLKEAFACWNCYQNPTEDDEVMMEREEYQVEDDGWRKISSSMSRCRREVILLSVACITLRFTDSFFTTSSVFKRRNTNNGSTSISHFRKSVTCLCPHCARGKQRWHYLSKRPGTFLQAVV